MRETSGNSGNKGFRDRASTKALGQQCVQGLERR